MALENANNKNTYTPSSDQTTFDFTFPYFATSDLVVTAQTSSTGTPTTLSFAATPLSNSQYKVDATNGDTEQGATITIGGSGYGAGSTVSIERVVPMTQTFDLQEGATIDPTALNKAFDRVVAQNQQQQDDLSKAISFPATDQNITYSIDEASASRAGKVIGFDSTGNVTTLTPSAISSSSSTIIAGGNGITNNSGTLSVNNDSDNLDFDGSGKLKIKTSGVTATELATDSVETAKIKDDAVTPAKISSVTGTDTNIVTGTAGTNGNLLKWDANGDAIDSGFNITDNDSLGTSDTTLATQGNIKAFANSLIPRCIVLDGSGIVVPDNGSETPGGASITQLSASAISNNYLDYFINVGTPSSGDCTITDATLTVPLSGLTSTVKTFSSTNIIGMWVRPQLQVDADDETGIIDSANPQVKIEYYMPRGQDDVSTLNDTNYRYDAIGWRRESEGGQLSNINYMVYIPVNARSGGQPSVKFRFNIKSLQGSLAMRAGLTLHAVNVVGLTT